jgi:hypothetical protein
MASTAPPAPPVVAATAAPVVAATTAPPKDTCEFDYDQIIVGGGPSGLCLATYLPGRTLLLERDATLGGIHKVRRDVDGYFGEHGPRVYSGCFVNLRRVLRDVGLEWDTVFVKSDFSPETIDDKHWYKFLSAREVLVLARHFLQLVFNGDHGKDITVQDVCLKHKFSERSTRYLDTLCRNIDGAGIERFALHELLHAFNDHGTGFYEPRQANDKALFPAWQRFLEQRGVVIKLATTVREITHSCGRATGVVALAANEPRTFTARTVIIAAPPVPMAAVIKASGLKEPGLKWFKTATNYDEYFSVAYHFPKTAAPVVTHRGLRSTPWGLIYLEMSRYMQGEGTYVSVAASRLDVRSPVTGKTANESSRSEVVQEMLRQLPIADATKATLIKAVPASCMKRTKAKWVNIDEAFIYNAAYPKALPFGLACCRGVYTVGCQNMRAWYPFTSIEAAVCNALIFMGKKQEVPFTPLSQLRALLLVVLVFLVLALARHASPWAKKTLSALRR